MDISSTNRGKKRKIQNKGTYDLKKNFQQNKKQKSEPKGKQVLGSNKV